MIGVPPTAGFLGKWFMLSGALQTAQWFAVAVIVVSSTVLNAGYFLPIVVPRLLRPGRARMRSGRGRRALPRGDPWRGAVADGGCLAADGGGDRASCSSSPTSPLALSQVDAREVSDGRAGPGPLARATGDHPALWIAFARHPAGDSCSPTSSSTTTRCSASTARSGSGAWYGFLACVVLDVARQGASAHSSSGPTPTTMTSLSITARPGPDPRRPALAASEGPAASSAQCWRSRC